MRKYLVPLLIVALLLAAAMPVAGQTTWQRFENVWAKSIKTTGNVTVGGTLTSTGAILASGDFVAVGTAGISGDLNVTDDVVIVDSLTVTGTAALGGNTTVAGTFAANGDSLTVAKTLYTARQTAIAVTDGATITPTGTLQELTATGAVGASVAAPGAAGRWVTLFNSTANTITITDTTGIALAGNAVLELNDSLTIFSTTAGQWVEADRSDN